MTNAPAADRGAHGYFDDDKSMVSVEAGPVSNATPYQLLPSLTAEEYAALRDDIATNGIRVPVDVDEHGQVLDGHHRQAIAAELGIDYPTRVVAGLTEEEKRHHALAVNLQRRTLTREQRRALITAELEHDPSRSDRAIGRLIGVDHKTVGAVRRGEIPQAEPMTREEAEAFTADIRGRLGTFDEVMVRLAVKYPSRVPWMLMKLAEARAQFRAQYEAELGDDFDVTDAALFGSRVEWLLSRAGGAP